MDVRYVNVWCDSKEKAINLSRVFKKFGVQSLEEDLYHDDFVGITHVGLTNSYSRNNQIKIVWGDEEQEMEDEIYFEYEDALANPEVVLFFVAVDL